MATTLAPVWRWRSTFVDVSKPVIVGVLNVTPDSFSDGGLYLGTAAAIDRGLALMAAGATLVDVGGESSRPGAEPVDAETELARVIPVIRELSAVGVPTSIDTMKPEVASAAVAAGSEVVNDVSGFRDPRMRSIVADTGAGAVLMHMAGTPRTMQDDPSYDDVTAEVRKYLEAAVVRCEEAGVDPESICVDPGIGFGKRLDHNLELIARIGEIVELGHPVMIGASRKRFLDALLDIPMASDRDAATALVTALAHERGARVFRVHDPESSARAVRLTQAILDAARPQPRT